MLSKKNIIYIYIYIKSGRTTDIDIFHGRMMARMHISVFGPLSGPTRALVSHEELLPNVGGLYSDAVEKNYCAK